MPGQWRPDEAAAEAAELPSGCAIAARAGSRGCAQRSRHGPGAWRAACAGALPFQPHPRGLRPPRSSTCRPSTSASPQHRHRLRPDQDRPGRHRRPEPARPARSCSSGRHAGPIRPASPRTSAACSPCQLRRLHGGTTGQGPADDRRITAIAAEMTATTPELTRATAALPPSRRRPARHFAETITGPRPEL
jgi:hypothetical protein